METILIVNMGVEHHDTEDLELVYSSFIKLLPVRKSDVRDALYIMEIYDYPLVKGY